MNENKAIGFVKNHKKEIVIGCLGSACMAGAYLIGLRKGSLSKYEEAVIDAAKTMLHEAEKSTYAYIRTDPGKVSDLGNYGETMLNFIPDEFTSESEVAGVMVMLK